MTPLQKKTGQAIVNIFETGKALGDYGSVTVLAGDTGHLTYGRSQTTLGSGNLARLLKAYCEAEGGLAEKLRPFLSSFEEKDVSLDTNNAVRDLLMKAGSDPVMQSLQDAFFDRLYWEPALKSADDNGISLPLGITVIYDSKIHGSFDLVRKRTNEQFAQADTPEEKQWINAYVTARREWLANHPNGLLHKTVYRMDAFRELIDGDKWELQLPLTIRSVVISEDILSAGITPAGNNRRVLALAAPMMKGEDVRFIQKALGFPEKDIDGIFGAATDRAVREFQRNNGLAVDGRVGAGTWAKLEKFTSTSTGTE